MGYDIPISLTSPTARPQAFHPRPAVRVSALQALLQTVRSAGLVTGGLWGPRNRWVPTVCPWCNPWCSRKPFDGCWMLLAAHPWKPATYKIPKIKVRVFIRIPELIIWREMLEQMGNSTCDGTESQRENEGVQCTPVK